MIGKFRSDYELAYVQSYGHHPLFFDQFEKNERYSKYPSGDDVEYTSGPMNDLEAGDAVNFQQSRQAPERFDMFRLKIGSLKME
uniref:Uncharacterized protein n=1 Tax=Romanomermis culicivorax TaxID=13658 RepID=A0A915KP30_ROMCU